MENSDKKIDEIIQDNLKKDEKLIVSNIKTSVRNGIVTLEGSIASLWHKARAEVISKAVVGVKEIINKLKVKPRQSDIIKELLSESITNKKLQHIVDAHLSKIECYFGLIGVSFAIIFIIFAALVTPGYNPLVNTVSELGKGVAKTLFSIAFVTSGSLTIPFILYLEKTLIGINEFVRRIATTLAVISALSVALVGILPDPEFPNVFMTFHGIVAITAFFGSAGNISLYSYLMMKSGEYKTYHIIIGYATGVDLILLGITMFNPLVEWILTVNIMLWILITSIKLIRD